MFDRDLNMSLIFKTREHGEYEVLSLMAHWIPESKALPSYSLAVKFSKTYQVFW